MPTLPILYVCEKLEWTYDCDVLFTLDDFMIYEVRCVFDWKIFFLH